MKVKVSHSVVVIISAILLLGCRAPESRPDDLFEAVQMNQVFSDQKKFVDCIPKIEPDSIRKIYRRQQERRDFDLRQFVDQYYDTTLLDTDTTLVLQHIDHLWDYLVRKPAGQPSPYSSLIALPRPYIVPGGRFREIYYWDSYFTMLGLREAGNDKMIENMVANFAYLVTEFGHVPNGNRSYYLSRSQPPLLSLMIDILSSVKDEAVYGEYADILEKEYRFWMRGAEDLGKDRNKIERVVLVEENGILNRYWDALQTPRPESYKHDVELLRRSDRDSMLFRDIRAAAESGWDFSTRWFADGRSLEMINTTRILPVDLNCLLYHLEMTLSRAYRYRGDLKKAAKYAELAGRRKGLIRQYFWNKEQGYFFDYDLATSRQKSQYTLAGLFPLFFKLVDSAEAERVIRVIEAKFLQAGGLVTTLAKDSGQQWDYPNGWAPLQWIGYRACRNYGFHALAREIARRWITLNARVYFETGQMMEKYDVVDIQRPGGGGEYRLQDGFGWTNGVFLKLWNELHESGREST